MERYPTIDHIYVEKLAELLGNKYYEDTSYNLILCKNLHKNGREWGWKTIYFAFVDYREWIDKQYNEEHYTSCGWWDSNEKLRYGSNKYDPDAAKLHEFLRDTSIHINERMTAEEFYFKFSNTKPMY